MAAVGALRSKGLTEEESRGRLSKAERLEDFFRESGADKRAGPDFVSEGGLGGGVGGPQIAAQLVQIDLLLGDKGPTIPLWFFTNLPALPDPSFAALKSRLLDEFSGLLNLQTSVRRRSRAFQFADTTYGLSTEFSVGTRVIGGRGASTTVKEPASILAGQMVWSAKLVLPLRSRRDTPRDGALEIRGAVAAVQTSTAIAFDGPDVFKSAAVFNLSASLHVSDLIHLSAGIAREGGAAKLLGNRAFIGLGASR